MCVNEILKVIVKCVELKMVNQNELLIIFLFNFCILGWYKNIYEDLQETTTPQGGTIYLHKGHRFVKHKIDKTKGETASYRCTQYINR